MISDIFRNVNTDGCAQFPFYVYLLYTNKFHSLLDSIQITPHSPYPNLQHCRSQSWPVFRSRGKHVWSSACCDRKEVALSFLVRIQLSLVMCQLGCSTIFPNLKNWTRWNRWPCRIPELSMWPLTLILDQVCLTEW